MRQLLSFSIRPVYQALIICTVVLVIYFPAINAEVSIVDDLEMITGITNSEGISLKDLLFPRSVGGGYYRPLIGLTYYIDNILWHMGSRFMHLENILLHLANALLLYCLARTIAARYLPEKKDLISIFAALLFALHPINTESVNWISGRTDLLAGMFVILSTILLIRYRFYGSRTCLALSILSILLAMLAKEVAFGFLLAFPFILNLREKKSGGGVPELPLIEKPYFLIIIYSSISLLLVLAGASFWVLPIAGLLFVLTIQRRAVAGLSVRQLATKGLLFCFLLIFVVAMFFVVRKIAFSSDIDKISNTLRLMYQDMGYSISVLIGASAFYVKKFLIPLPLSFYILEIDPLYDLAGIFLFFWGLYILMRNTVVSALCITGVSLFLPALPFAFATIAWTGYAERYIYISSAFWSLAFTVVLFNSDYLEKYRGALIAFFLALLALSATITINRNLLWKTNMGLIADTVAKNPKQKELRGLYMLALIHKGELKAAREQYMIASSLHSTKYLENYDLNMAGIEMAEGNEKQAEKLLLKVIVKSGGKSANALKYYTKFLENLLVREVKAGSDVDTINEIRSRLVDRYIQLYAINSDPFITYRLGQLFLNLGDNAESIKWLEKTVQAYPEENVYGKSARTILLKLRKEQ